MTAPDSVNRASWADPSTVHWFRGFEGWSDAGEQAAVESLATEMRDRRVLDLGIGAGRTTALLRDLTDDYVGIDYLPEMVDAARAKHPDKRIELGDARDLGRFEDEQFDLVVFSWNGIDAVDHVDRRQILREVQRVLRPGGTFLFSTHNLDGPGYGQKPWGNGLGTVLHPRMVLGLATHLPSNLRGYRLNRGLEEEHGDWGMRVAAAHGFGLVIHYTTVAAARAELAEAGFEPEPAIYESTGSQLAPGAGSRAFWLHLLAQKPVRA